MKRKNKRYLERKIKLVKKKGNNRAKGRKQQRKKERNKQTNKQRPFLSHLHNCIADHLVEKALIGNFYLEVEFTKS